MGTNEPNPLLAILGAIRDKFPNQSGGKVPVVQASTPDTTAGDLAKISTLYTLLNGIINSSKLDINIKSGNPSSTPDTSAGDLAKITALEAKFAALIDSQAPVIAGSRSKTIKITFTGIGAYSAHDALGTLVEIPAWAFANGRGGILRGCRICAAKKSITPQLRIHFFKAATATVAADNAQWKDLFVDDDIRAGFLDMPTMTTAADTVNSNCSRAMHDTYGDALSMMMNCAAPATSLWALIEVVSPGATAFDGSPGNTIDVYLVMEQL